MRRYDVIGEPTFDFDESVNGNVIFYDDFVDFIKSFLDIDCYNNKSVWDNNTYLEEHYPAQFLIKNLLK